MGKLVCIVVRHMQEKRRRHLMLAGIEPSQERTRPKDVAITAGILAATVLITELLRFTSVEDQSLVIVYLLSVLVTSRVTNGFACGIAAAFLSTFIYDLLITAPRLNFSFTIRFPFTLIIMLIATFLTSAMTVRVKRQAAVFRDRESRARLLYEMNQELLGAPDVDTIVQVSCQYLVSHLERAAVFYTGDPKRETEQKWAEAPCGKDGVDLFHSQEEMRRAHRIFQSGGVDPAVLFDDTELRVYYMPVISRDRMLGLIGISCEDGPLDHGELMFVKMLTGQVALALELRIMSDEQSKANTQAEKEKMRSTLLRAISHDLRTPLTSILGASSTLLEQRELEGETRDKLLMDIRENAQWLIRMVENILTITRISQETMKVQKTLEAAEEVVEQAVSIVRGRFPDWQIHVHIPGEVLMVPMDATLISQVIINLLENAVKNSPSGSLILMNLSRQEGNAVFDVSDNGNGIPEQVLENLFQTHAQSREQFIDAVRGLGIGLSICQAIVGAHGGTIEGTNRSNGGARFTFTLPLQEGDRG